MAERNLPIITLPVAPETYDQRDQDQLRNQIRGHWHPGTGGTGSAGPVTAFATVLLPLDNGTSPIVGGMFITPPITFQYTIVGYRLIEDCGFAGSIELKVEYASADAFPTFTEISGTQRPQLIGSRVQQRTTLDGWTQVVGEAYSQLRATVVGDAIALTRIELAIALTRVDTPTTGGGGGGGPDDDSGITGTAWFDGAGAPSDTLGNDGDYYLDDSSGDVYKKSAGHWTIVANLGTTSFTPTLIPALTSFTVPANKQTLYKLPIRVLGDLIVRGDLVEVD